MTVVDAGHSSTSDTGKVQHQRGATRIGRSPTRSVTVTRARGRYRQGADTSRLKIPPDEGRIGQRILGR